MLVTERNFDRALDGFVGFPRLILDTETTGTHPWLGHRICGISLATPFDYLCYFPFRHRPGGNLPKRCLRQLIRFLSRRRLLLTGWNLKFDLEMLSFDGLPLPEYAEDVMLACHHVNENDKPFELKRWAARYVDPSAADAEAALKALLKSRKLGEHDIAELWPDEVEEYACDDVHYTERLRQKAIKTLTRWKTRILWEESNQYMLELAKMEMHGFRLDLPLLEKYNNQAKRNARKAYRTITELAGYEINLRSPKQLCLFLKVSSSRKEILEEMDTPEAQAILTFRAWDKASGTYYEPWLKWKADDILHPNLNLHRVVTGRQSASDPNMHAVPKYRPEYKIKDIVVARPGYVIVSADYNQAELRVGVSVAKEDRMAKLFQSADRVDIHQLVADKLRIHRDPAKTINFMILYGGGEDKLADKLKITVAKARKYLRAYHTEYWHFRYTSNWWANRARSQGYIRLWTGRVRHFNHPLANPKDAFNSLVQGGVAEMLRIAIQRLGHRIPRYNTHMLLQIHDQILFEVPVHQVTNVVPIIRAEMENFPHWMIPPKVDIKIGTRWGQLEDYDEWRKAA